MDVRLTVLGQLMARCWETAEENLRTLVAQKHPSPSEEQVTLLFAGELRTAVAKASSARQVENAFLTDLRRSIPRLDPDVARRVNGLVARVNLHDRWHEGNVSAADLGIVVRRPIVRLASGGRRVEFRRNHGTGLLAQAKLARSARAGCDGHKWDSLTDAQARLFPKRREYYSLLLYRVNGAKADELAPFGWQLCSGHNLRQVKKWLRLNAFPEEIASSAVLTKLFARQIGTEDPKVIEKIIDPAASDIHCIDLHIFWPGDKGPPPSVDLYQQRQQPQYVRICQ